MTDERTAIVIGASSGIGAALARRLGERGYTVGITARRRPELETVAESIDGETYVTTMDVANAETARETFHDLDEAMGGATLVVISAAILRENPELSWPEERGTIDVNVRGFTALSTAAIEAFERRGRGHLVGISSLAAHVGVGQVPAYPASKAFVSRYLEGLRFRASGRDADVTVTTIEPGYVDTGMALGDLWIVSAERAARAIVRAIERNRAHAYVPRRWALVAALLAILPDVLLRRLLS